MGMLEWFFIGTLVGRSVNNTTQKTKKQLQYTQPNYNEWLRRSYVSEGTRQRSAKNFFMQDFKVLASQGWGVFEFNGIRGAALFTVKVEGNHIDVTYGRYTPPSLQHHRQ